jgi:hypothetical protein
MPTQEREIIDLLWDTENADALAKIKDMLQVRAAQIVGDYKAQVADSMFPDPYATTEDEVIHASSEQEAEDETEVDDEVTEEPTEETTDETDNRED